MSTPSLPAYPSDSSEDSHLDVAHDLPTYTRTTNTEWDIPPAEQQHNVHLETKKTGARWLTLVVTSRAASDDEQPTFYPGGNVTGSVRLTLEKQEVMDQISIDVSNPRVPHTTAEREAYIHLSSVRPCPLT